MKKLITLITLIVCSTFYAQDNIVGGIPVEGVTIIKREKISTNKVSIPNYNTILNRRPDDPIGDPIEIDPIDDDPIEIDPVEEDPHGGGGGIDPSLIVTSTGITKGELNVSLTGGATYSIPIAVPPGISGTIPQVNLIYNSQGTNGLAGYGWNVSGVSTITRIGTTKFHDNIIDGVDFDVLDRFAIDGQRLMLKSGTYGADGAEYQTENYSNIKITTHGVSSFGPAYGPSYFLVQYPDGSKAYYGQNINSSSKTEWAITYWENPIGVRISYEYYLTNNILSISKIKYGTKGSTPAINVIQFLYKTRQRAEQYYVGGLSFTNSNILSQIKVIGNGVGYRNYYLTHNITSLGYERLTSITEKTGDNSKSLNPTTFSYTDTINEIYQSGITSNLSISNINSTGTGTITGDFDGDGSLDLILYPKTGVDENNKYWLFTDLSNSNTYNIGAEHNVGSFKKIFPITWLNDNNKLMPQQGWSVIKYNGYFGTTSFNNYSAGITSPIYFQNTKEYQFPKIVISNVVINEEIPKNYIEGDFNGDGLTDLLVIEKSKSYSYNNASGNTVNGTHPGGRTFFVDLDRRKTDFVNLAGNILSNNDSVFQVGDFNGDGKSNLLVFNDGTIKVYGINLNNQLELISNYSDSQINISRELLLGDYNGDGKIDLLIPIKHSSTYIQYDSNGLSFVKSNKNFNFYYNGTNQQILANDFDLDGKTDLIHLSYAFDLENIYGGRFDQIWVSIHNNLGTNFNVSCDRKITFPKSGLVALPMYLNSSIRNLKSELAFMVDDKIYYAFGKKNFSKEKLLKEITLGNGVKETITYQALVGDGDLNAENVPVFTPTTYTESYPNHDIKLSPIFDVVTLIEHRSKSQYKKQAFGYYGAVSNLEGLGFLGFRAILKTNWYNNSYQKISSVSKHDLSRRAAVIESYSFLNTSYNFFNTPSSFITRSIMNYEDELLVNKVYKIKNTSSTIFNGLDGTSKEVITTFDNFNNPTQNITNYKLGTSIEKTEKADYIFESPTASPYIVGRVIQKNIEVNYGGSTMTSEEIYSYNGNQLLSQVKKKGNGTDYLTENNQYDGFGNVIQKTISAVGLTPRITNYEYDTTGRFLTKSVDIEGLATNYTYNNSTGQLLTETNPYGLTTTYTYDVWLRKRKVIDYLGNKKTYLFQMTNTTDVKLTTTNDEGGQNISIFDDLGRESITGSKNIDNSWSFIKTDYDIYDRKKSISEPYVSLTGSPTQFNRSSFDEYGRLIQTISYTGKTTNISYSGLTSTMNDGFKTVSTTKNAADVTVSMTDDGGTINYQHYPNGNMKQSNYGGVIISIDQDGWGRKTKLTDPSAGVYEYVYNDFGELTWEKTPKGETTYTLNSVGKVTQKEVLGDNTHLISYYNYDGTTKLLTGITTNTSTSYSYEYDTYKRLWRTTEFSPYAHYQMASVFDSFGRVEKEYQYILHVATGKSSSKWTKNTYKNGFHWQILDDATSQVLWETNTINTRGQLTSATLGNGIAISKTYDNFGFITQSKHDLAGTAPVNIMTLNTTFEPQRGNLTSRYNSMFAWNETFQYDTLDRLTHYTDATGNQVQQIYDNRGRISDNNQGHYNYSGPVYQNSSIDPTPETFNYYQNRSNLDVSYNAFKSPVEIYEAGFDRISFDYNVFQSRSTMYYGSLEVDKLQRKYRKHYTALGSMEIKHNTQTNEVEFITYIGGDGYTAPVVLKSDGTIQNYLYLHRDYLGSIVAITNESGQLVEKRLFDAWGLIVKVQDGTGNVLTGLVVLDRGYTGHEHLQGVNLIHMNGRLYDPLVHRFLQPDNFIQDPYNTQNFNRYGYVLNNPLKWIDPSGESFASWWNNNWKQVVTVAAVVVVTAVVTIASAGTATPLLVAIYAGIAGGATGGIVGTALNGGSAGDIITAGITGGILGGISGAVGGWAASFAPPGIINGALYGGSTNAVIGGLSDIAMGGDGTQGAVMGFGLGFIGGAAHGYATAKASGANVFTGKVPSPEPSNLASGLDESFSNALDRYYDKTPEISFKAQAEPTSLGSSRTQIKSYLKNMENLDKATIIDDIESVGFKNVYNGDKGGGAVWEHTKIEGLKIRLDSPHIDVPFEHMHINFGNKFNSFDINLRPVNFNSPGAHIPFGIK
ncbi:RHS repeat-associated core domain-containing protein [Flavobacterium sp.]|uniref:RHS repeat-associated core domain-containing protein n=1 Tax=Flavobacterium sp. TaxID=239 RepID=UPI003D2B04DF